MAGHIAVDQDLITSHAARVEVVASDIAVARDAAGSTNMGGGAFGVLCSFLVGPASLAASMAQQTIQAAEGMVRRSATELRGVGTDMAAFEDDVVQGVAALGSGLE
jgi:hypothetical protein